MDKFPNGAGYMPYEDVPRDLEEFTPTEDDLDIPIEELEEELNILEDIEKDY